MAAEAGYEIHRTERFKNTGNPAGLRNSFLVAYDKAGFTFMSTPFYSSYVDQGRGWVFPIRAKCLRFVIDGRVIFAMKARPSRPRLFMQEAQEHLENVAETVFDRVFSGGAS